MPNCSRRGFLAGLGAAAAAHWLHADSGELCALSLREASGRIRSRTLSPVELTEACLDRIKIYNPKINAWITVMREKALEQAKALAQEQAAGHLRGPLHGIPIGLKDSIDVAGVRTTAASAVYANHFAAEDSEVARRLRAAGAVLIGKCNMHEFDAGATSAVSYWGPVRNPWNLERVAGGASGGSAAAVAMENCFAALGTDAGGDLRLPAAYCGAVAIKPTYGRVSLRGIVPFAWSLDHCGPIARSVEDAALVLQSIAGYDPLDIDSIDRQVPDYSAALRVPVAELRLGVAAQFYDHLDDEVARATDDALAVFNKLTKGPREVGLPSLLKTGAVLVEMAAYHETLHPVNGGGYEPATARVFPGAQDPTRAPDYIRAWRELELIRRTVDEDVFRKQNVDVLIAPAARHLPLSIEEELVAAGPAGAAGGRGATAPDPAVGGRGAVPAGEALTSGGRSGGRGANAQTRAQIDPQENTRPFNAYGLPVVTVPCGFSKDGLPIGLQIAGPRFGEGVILSLAHAYEQATEWHKRRPGLAPDAKAPALSKAASEQTGG